MHVVMISKACIVGTYQRKLEELARQPDLRLSVIVPPYWRDDRGIQPLERAHVEGYDLLVTPLAFNGQFHIHFYPRLRSVLRSLRPDLLHVDEEPYNLATYQGIKIAKQLSVPACFFTWQNLHRSYPPPFRWFEAFNYRNARLAIAGTSDARCVLEEKGFTGPVRIVPQFGVDPEAFRPLEARRSEDTACRVIGFAGGLVWGKGVDLLLKALSEITDKPWKLKIAGSGGEEPDLHRLTEALGIEDRVEFVGRVPSLEMRHFYQSLDVLALPSRSLPNWREQFGRVLVEAMACAVPVVGSDSGEIPHVIGDAGLLFAEEDVAGLRECLRTLIDDDGFRAELGQRARVRVLENFSQSQIAERTAAAYRSMLDDWGV